MSAVADTPAARAPRASRQGRKPGDQSPRLAPAPVAKSKDAGKTKVSFYLDAEVAMKLALKAIKGRVDQSDLANEILGRDVSSIVCFDRNDKQAKATCDNGEDRQEEVAA